MLERKELEAAANWYVQLTAQPGHAPTQAAWQRWLAADTRHAQAWAQVEKLQRQFAQLSPEQALPTLAGARARRRQVLKVLGVLLAAGATGTGALLVEPLPSRLARYRTGKGERRHLQLADGSRLLLDTDTRADVHFNERRREVQLHRGRLLLESAADPAHRPLLVLTPQGSVRALGTRFSVSSQGEHSTVQVFEHAVELRPLNNPGALLRVEAGERSSFDRQGHDAIAALPPGSDGWTRGMLMTLDWRLREVLTELARYRPGYLTCTDAAAGLRVTGAFRLDDSDAALGNLASALPIRIQYLTRYWVRIDLA
ncbi:FecR domain-containing protein [Pseudomonas cremoricolorata]|uniref:FecR domain-containing protein n=1 Tax=Pseudomonas cremoricolorata TaxID=157783 RepID=UPI00040480DC|nr:FecR domain-containing protein [Pseudomonas cremoricolorata]